MNGDDDHILFIRSDSSNSFYPENKPFHFKVNLGEPLYLEGNWEIALLDFYSNEKITMTKKNTHELYIFCDLCTDVSLFQNQYSLLRRIFPTSQKTWNNIFSRPVFVPVKKTEIRDLEIHIFDENGEEASFLSSHLSCTPQIRTRNRRRRN